MEKHSPTDCVAGFAISADDSKIVCPKIREIIPDAFDGADFYLASLPDGDSAFVLLWHTDDYFRKNVHQAIMLVVGRESCAIDYCLLEVLGDGATFGKFGRGKLENYFVAKRCIAVSDEFRFL